MDKDFDKLQEFVEIMKVSIYRASTILGFVGGDTRPCFKFYCKEEFTGE